MSDQLSSERIISSGAYGDFALLLKDHLNDNESKDSSAAEIPSPYDVNNITSSYWDTEDLSKYLSSNPADYYLHMNVQGLSPKYELLQIFLSSLSREKFENLPTVIALSETWLCKENELTFGLSGYQQLVPNSRTDSEHHGGVGLYIREGINFTLREDLSIFVPFIFCV